MSTQSDNQCLPNESQPLLIGLWFLGLALVYVFTGTKYLGLYVGGSWYILLFLVGWEVIKINRSRKAAEPKDAYWRAVHRNLDI